MKQFLQLLNTTKISLKHALITATGLLAGITITGILVWSRQWHTGDIVRVKSPNLEAYYTERKGFLNLDSLMEGDLYMVDIVHREYLYVMNIALTDEDLITTPPIDTVRSSKELSSITEADLELRGKIAQASQEVKAELKEKIASKFSSHITKYYRRRLRYPLQKINEKRVLEAMKDQKKTDAIFMLVTDVGYGDHLEIGVDRSMAGDAKSTVMQVGEFDVQVVFDCETSLVLSGNNLRLFYKLTPFTYNATKGCFELYRQDVDHHSYLELWSH